MFSLALRSAEFLFYQGLLGVVDRVSRLPRNTQLPEAMRLYRENIALKAQLDALERTLVNEPKRRRVPVRVRAAQVFAYFLTRGNPTFQRYSLSATLPTILRWATTFRRGQRTRVGRPPLPQVIVDLVVQLKRENSGWGQRRIREELRRMGIRVSEPTVQRISREQGLLPGPRSGGPRDHYELVRSAAKDAVWALDYFGVRTARGAWMQVLLVIDLYTRELIDLRVHDGLDVDSAWTAMSLNAAMARLKRRPAKVVHDRGSHFKGQFSRQLRVLEIEESITRPHTPIMNCFAESAIRGVRFELVNHIRVSDAADLQRHLDEYRRYRNSERAHQGIDGQTPEARAANAPEAPLIDLADLRQRRVERRSYAHGLLNGYSLALAA